jgi:hypothetical protein
MLVDNSNECGLKVGQLLEEAVRCPLQPRPRQAPMPDA